MDTASKVTVEYRDPSDVFKLVSRDLNARLPLRNLDWKAQNRPVRQIKSLHLDFVPDSLTKNTLQPPAPRQDSERTTSFDIVGNGATKNAVKERRHQIPGLQTSPYLKLYVLRCDDKDRYKSVERDRVKDWLKQVTSTKAKGNHDACDWLILHVVIPDTQAASEPRWRETAQKDQEDQEELLERKKQGAKWPGKSKRTVFDKLRADFNEKGAQDRVAQIKLPKEGFPVDLLPTTVVAAPLKETPEERGKAWDDLMGKIRILTLTSFEKRVNQYQSDITELELRRSMPGFNFCTFFIYKEGLAKALDSVGLLEDALVIYDELSLGLETAVRDVASGNSGGTATTFASHTDDIKERITGEDKPQTNGTDGDHHKDQTAKEKAEKVESEFRERIAKSEISIFDFFNYLFNRQQAIILRIANGQAARAKLGLTVKEGSEDLILISEVCWRATTFIHNNARILRQDLLRYREDKPWTELSDADVENLVASWMYDAAGKVLDDTGSYEIDNASHPSRQDSIAGGYANHSRSESNLSAGSIPQRTTSLPPKKSRVTELQGRPSLQSASENDLVSRPSSSSTDTGVNTITSQPGLAELITYRASLVMLQRKALEVPAKQRGWFAGWASVRDQNADRVHEVDLNGDVEEPYQNGIDHSRSRKGPVSNMLSPTLMSSLSSESEYYEAYGHLSEQAMRYFVTSTQTKSTESIIGDLAILKNQQDEFEYAISYFQHVLQLYAEDGWSLMEQEGIRIYASCLRKMARNEEYIQTMLMLLAKVCAKKQEKRMPRAQFEIDDGGAEELDGLLSELVRFSTTLEQEIITPAERYFKDVHCEREIQHFEDRDGFSLRVRVHHLLDELMFVEKVSLRLVSVEDSNQEIWLHNRDSVSLSLGSNEFDLGCNAVTFGGYWIDRLVLQSGMLQFEYGFGFKQATQPLEFESFSYITAARSPESAKQPWVFLYPAVHSFDAEATLPNDIKPEARSVIEIRLSSGWNEVHNIDLKLKPASSGLRLYLADARTPDIVNKTHEASSVGCLALGGLKTNDSAVVRVPYTLEQKGMEIAVRLEAWYHTSQGSFVFTISSRIPTRLPLDVDVQETFHFDTLFSTFTIRSASQMPLCVTNTELDSSLKYEVKGPPNLAKPMVLFDKQPVKLVYRITRNAADMEKTDDTGNTLTLTTHYYTIDEVLRQALITSFGEALNDSPFSSLSRLLLPLLLARAKSLLWTSDMEMALLLHEVPTPSFEDVAWQEIIPTLPSAVRPQLSNWLKLWHSKNISIPLSHEMAETECLRRITVSADVPQVDVVHKSSIVLPTETIYGKALPPILILGQPITVQLKITSTNEWGNRSNNSPDNKRIFEGKKFTYDIQADPDTWLVGGQRRVHFAATAYGEVSFELLLVPLKRGTWHLPHVDVQLARSDGSSDTVSTDKHGPPLRSESFYESAGQVVNVIRDVNKGRVHLAESHASLHSRNNSRAQAAKDTG